MDGTKTYVFGSDANSSLAPLLAGMNNNSALTASLANNGGFGGNNGWWIIILLMALYGNNWNGNGNSNNVLEALNGNTGRDMLMQAISGNGTAISQLASTLNCDINALQTGLNAINQSICSVGNTVGMSSQQIINSVQAGDANIANQIASCCCNVREAITTQGFENRLATQEQTNFLGAKIDYQTNVINDKFCQLELRELQNKVDALREEKSTLKAQISNAEQTAAIQAYQTATIAPISSALNALSNEVASIKCHLPQTVTLPYSPATAVPNCVAYGLGYGNFFSNNGYWG